VSIDKGEKTGVSSQRQLRVEGGIPLPPQDATRGSAGTKPSTSEK
jgi:hypothetical protein